jgi:hypothetical protein
MSEAAWGLGCQVSRGAAQQADAHCHDNPSHRWIARSFVHGPQVDIRPFAVIIGKIGGFLQVVLGIHEQSTAGP